MDKPLIERPRMLGNAESRCQRGFHRSSTSGTTSEASEIEREREVQRHVVLRLASGTFIRTPTTTSSTVCLLRLAFFGLGDGRYV